MIDRPRGWRRWVASAAFLLAVAVIGSRMCQSESASAEIRFMVGDAGAELRRLEVELYRPGDQELIGFYRRNYQAGSGPEAGRWPLRVDPGMYRATIGLGLRTGTRWVERTVEIADRAIITIDLERDLTAR